MIRINLLPQAKRATRGSSSGTAGQGAWFIGYAAAAALAVAICLVLYFAKLNDLSAAQSANAELTEQIARITRESANLEAAQAQLQRSHDLEQVVTELQRARFGPTKVLMEVSHILSVNGGPTIDPQRLEEIRRANPLAGFNRGWDTRRLWLTSFAEIEREVKIKGQGKTNEDVAEFLRRLALSDSFGEVRLDKTEAVEDQTTHLPLISFELTAHVRY
jgi:type IV pilus assembly protein PilN